ncbi:MAG: lipid-A-disaccharide synthase N-terminal domain-containing protein [Candidatus Omnitrophota bacterium]
MNTYIFLGIKEQYWLYIGFLGQFLFGARFLVQWVCSEIKKESYLPIVFWYFSLGGGFILLLYSISIQNPVFILGQSMGLIVYLRNLRLIYKKRNKVLEPLDRNSCG